MVMEPFFQSKGPGFCSPLTCVPGLVLVQCLPSSVLVETTIGPDVARMLYLRTVRERAATMCRRDVSSAQQACHEHESHESHGHGRAVESVGAAQQSTEEASIAIAQVPAAVDRADFEGGVVVFGRSDQLHALVRPRGALTHRVRHLRVCNQPRATAQLMKTQAIAILVIPQLAY